MKVDDFVKQLKMDLVPRLKGKVVIVGVGNAFRGDDGIGPEAIKRLEGKVQAALYNCGEAPENYLEKIIAQKPDTIIIIDTARIGRRAGNFRVLDAEEIEQFGLSTHSLSLKLFIDYIKKSRECDIFVLGVQPKTLVMGTGLSDEVKKSLIAIEKVLSENRPSGS